VAFPFISVLFRNFIVFVNISYLWYIYKHTISLNGFSQIFILNMCVRVSKINILWKSSLKLSETLDSRLLHHFILHLVKIITIQNYFNFIICIISIWQCFCGQKHVLFVGYILQQRIFILINIFLWKTPHMEISLNNNTVIKEQEFSISCSIFVSCYRFTVDLANIKVTYIPSALVVCNNVHTTSNIDK